MEVPIPVDGRVDGSSPDPHGIAPRCPLDGIKRLMSLSRHSLSGFLCSTLGCCEPPQRARGVGETSHNRRPLREPWSSPGQRL